MEHPAQPAPRRILSVGQCFADQMSLSAYFADRFRIRIDEADGPEDARAALGSTDYSLVLVNRLMDRDGSSGLDLIRALQEDPATKGVPIMLVSDYPEAQDAARELGAVLGFGKSVLYRSETFQRIKQALGE